MKKLCVVSHSGGLDSSTLIAKAIALDYIVQPINFNYGQKNLVETEAQKNIWNSFKKMYGDRIKKPLYFDFNLIMAETLDSFKELRDSKKIEETTKLEYYMPFRNMLFASMCSMIGELISLYDEDISEIAIGIGVHKHSSDVYVKDYWDITPKFVEKLNSVLELNDTIKVSCFAPYVDSFKEDIISDALILEVPYLQTWTCYNPVFSEIINEEIEATPCRVCEACIERELQGQKAGVDNINEYSLSLKQNPTES